MVKIRLKRLGSKRNPIYRIIVIDVREKREGKPITELGFYNPKRKELKLNKGLAQEWVNKGAKPTETVQFLINNSDENGSLIRKEVEKKLSKKAKAKLEAEEKAKAEAAASEETAEAPAEETQEEATA